MNSHIEIRVADTGKGIKPEFFPFVFERFSQAENPVIRMQGGLGMGLAIAKTIVELHGGTIAAYSEGAGKGAVFTVTIPIMAVNTEAGTGEYAQSRRGWNEISLMCPPELSGLKALVVDDDSDTCDMICAVLERCGALVRTANDAEGALEAFSSWKPAVLISDIGLAGVDGYELLSRIREMEKQTGSKTPAVALTGFARIGDRVKALASGYQMHVAKPVEPAELLTIVASLAGLIDRT